MNTHQPILLTTTIVIPNVFVLRIQAMNLDDPMPNNQLECAPLFGTVLLLHDGWKTFTSSSVFSSSSFSTGATGGFKGVTTSSAMIESSLALTKIKWVVGIILYLHLEGVDAFYLTN
jgi:hypothetical protein